jgi:hypothetical protein
VYWRETFGFLAYLKGEIETGLRVHFRRLRSLPAKVRGLPLLGVFHSLVVILERS